MAFSLYTISRALRSLASGLEPWRGGPSQHQPISSQRQSTTQMQACASQLHTRESRIHTPDHALYREPHSGPLSTCPNHSRARLHMTWAVFMPQSPRELANPTIAPCPACTFLQKPQQGLLAQLLPHPWLPDPPGASPCIPGSSIPHLPPLSVWFFIFLSILHPCASRGQVITF